MVQTPKGINTRNRIYIKDAAMQDTQVTPKPFKSMQAPARTTNVPRIAAKTPSIQPTDVLSAVAKSPSHQHTLPVVLTNQPGRSTSEPFLSVQSYVPQPQPAIKVDKKPVTPQESGDNDNGIPKVPVYKPPEPVQKDTTNLSRCSRVSTSHRKYFDSASIVKNTKQIMVQ